ncbi:AAA family ATPase [Euhalothece natronophila Z-M001]|uniref:AAA family ATPase n=1 Tax=Euhalothece natronophila Z-M001 TaxID=522448 RepID=A0A5B8NNR2_9CHRO|nr:AAA family ATPase [Euhalothece natronophila]QDZ39835.1 AAA family ATPase [Euhalothece natronophila Z-M001]
MKKIALITQKGGAGKTTLALSLAVAAEQAGETTVIYDLDPQATACNWGDRREVDRPVIVDVQPARLNKAIERAEKEGVDLIILDTPPRSEQASLAAAKVADLIIIPCRPQIYDLETLRNTQELIQYAGNQSTLVVLNAVPSRGTRHEQAKRAIQQIGLTVASAQLGSRAAFGDAGALGLTALEYEPQGKAAEEILNVYKSICHNVNK